MPKPMVMDKELQILAKKKRALEGLPTFVFIFVYIYILNVEKTWILWLLLLMGL